LFLGDAQMSSTAAKCCFGPFVLLVVSLVKFGICIVPVTLLLTLGSAVTSLLGIILDIVLAYWSIAVSPQLGKNITVLLLLTIAAPIFLIPVVLVGASVLASTIGTLVYVFVETFDQVVGHDFECWSTKTFSVAQDAFKTYWDIAISGRRERYHNLRQDDGTHFEIKFTHMIGGLLLSVLGMVIDGISLSILFALKLIPTVLRGLMELTKLYFTSKEPYLLCLCFIFYIVGVVAVLVLVPASYPFCCIAALLYGVKSAMVMYQHDSLTHGFLQIFKTIYEADRWTNDLIFGWRQSIFECWNFELERPVVRAPPSVNQMLAVQGRVKLSTIWDTFFDLCTGFLRLELARGDRNINVNDPNFAVRLTGLVIFHYIAQSNVNSIRISDHLELTNANRPLSAEVDLVYEKCVAIRQNLYRPYDSYSLERYEKWVRPHTKVLVDAINDVAQTIVSMNPSEDKEVDQTTLQALLNEPTPLLPPLNQIVLSYYTSNFMERFYKAVDNVGSTGRIKIVNGQVIIDVQ
jgi:hypothetical protein